MEHLGGAPNPVLHPPALHYSNCLMSCRRLLDSDRYTQFVQKGPRHDH